MTAESGELAAGSGELAAEPGELRATIEHLYGLPLDEFIPARDAAAKERRNVKDRDGAETLKRLRKPNLVAWAVNRARRSDPDAVRRLIDAGDRLADAQRQLVGGGERGLLREAAAAERAAVVHVAERAEAELAASGHTPDASTQSKLFATLHAAAANPEVRDQLADGRLVRDYELSDLGLAGAGAAAIPAADPSAAERSREEPAGAVGERSREKRARTVSERTREKRVRAVGERLERAKARQAETDEQAKQARGRQRDAERALRDAAKELERAEAAVKKATAAAAQAAQSVVELEAERDRLT